MTSLYDFSVLNQDHQETPLETYRGKILLIVNTATGCGLTPQYQGLQELYERYQEQGLRFWTSLAISLWDKHQAAQRKSTPSVAYIINPPSHVLPRSRSTVRKQILSMFG